MIGNVFKKGVLMVLGGAKSGKSRYALDLCNMTGEKRIFVATAQALDDEMYQRIERHKAERGSRWKTVEESLNITEVIQEYDNEDSVILLDCVTLWISNLLMKCKQEDRYVSHEVERLAVCLEGVSGTVVVVSNDVGMGIVPDNPLSRRYRDLLGLANQRIARASDVVVMLVAGLPVILKQP